MGRFIGFLLLLLLALSHFPAYALPDGCFGHQAMRYCQVNFAELWAGRNIEEGTIIVMNGYLVFSEGQLVLYAGPESFFYGMGAGGVRVEASGRSISAAIKYMEPIVGVAGAVASACPSMIMGEFHSGLPNGDLHGKVVVQEGDVMVSDPAGLCSV